MDFLFIFVIFKPFKHSQTRILFNFVVFISNVISINSVWWCFFPSPNPFNIDFLENVMAKNWNRWAQKPFEHFIRALSYSKEWIRRESLYFFSLCYYYQLLSRLIVKFLMSSIFPFCFISIFSFSTELARFGVSVLEFKKKFF